MKKAVLSALLLSGFIATTLSANAVCPCMLGQQQAKYQAPQAKTTYNTQQAYAAPCPTCKKFYPAGAMGKPYTPQPCSIGSCPQPCPCPAQPCPCG